MPERKEPAGDLGRVGCRFGSKGRLTCGESDLRRRRSRSRSSGLERRTRRSARDWSGSRTSSADGGAAADGPYADPTGDNEVFGPDVTEVVVSNDAAGTVSIRVEVPNLPRLRPGDFGALFLDTDGRRATGDGTALGADYAVAFDGTTGKIDLARWNEFGWSFSTQATTLRASWDSGASLTVHRNELGGTPGFNFWIGAVSTDLRGSSAGDLAPDAGLWSYSLTGLDPNASSQGPVLDSSAPRVRALAGRGRAGHTLRLRYRASDDSGVSRRRIFVFRAGHVVAMYSTGFRASARGVTYSVAWRAPRGSAGRLHFCVEAWDRSGNLSEQSCALLRIRRN